jgi:hypothetical protein
MPLPTRRRVRASQQPPRQTTTPLVVNLQHVKGAPPPDPNGVIEVRLFDGARRPAPNVQALIRLFNGRQQLIYQGSQPGPAVRFTDLHVEDNVNDRWIVAVAVKGCRDTGFTPVIIKRGETTRVDLMLIPKSSSFDFTPASWTTLSSTDPRLVAFLSSGATSATASRTRYEALMAAQPRALAGLLNIWTAMASIHLADGSPIDYLRQLDWTDNPPAPDRFYCHADPALVTEVLLAATQGTFSPEPNPQVFHHGATRSYKQVQFGEANVQLTFHEHDTKVIDGTTCILLEPDIDYYKDLLAHGLLEVAPGKITEPEQVYVLRWTAGQQAGVPPFEPPFTIVPAQTRAMAITGRKRGVRAHPIAKSPSRRTRGRARPS